MSNISTSDPTDWYDIYTGPWINWSHGRTLGATITLTRRDGGFLISLIALFVTWTGTAFWRVSCYLLHHYCSSEAPRDGLYHQQQAILRNSANGISGLWALCQMTWIWSRKTSTPRARSRMTPLLAFTIACLSCFAVAGIMSSKIATSTGSEVLISSSRCGQLNTLRNTNFSLQTMLYGPFLKRRFLEFSNYAQNCYTDISNPEECKKYVQQQLQWTANRNASCPFAEELCRNNVGNLELTSGFIDNNDHLGFNAPPEQRLRFRSQVKCAPLVTDGYSQSFKYAEENDTTEYMRYFYGELLSGMNFTYEQPIIPIQVFSNQNFTSALLMDYTLSFAAAAPYNGSLYNVASSTFIPIPELRHAPGDICLFFLSPNFVQFTRETEDPWYSAHIPFMNETTSQFRGDKLQLYFADEPTSILGCVSQHQICSPNLPADNGCTTWESIYDTINTSQDVLDLGQTQYQFLVWIAALLVPTLAEIVESIGISSLTSRYGLTQGIQGPLAPNQWQLDVEHWFTVWLANLQGFVLLMATGPSNPDIMPWVETPESEIERRLCKSQKIVSTSYTNFNTFGLCLTFIVGTIIIVLSYTIEPLASWIQKRRRLDTYSRLEWSINETLQLQRLAHEELGVGVWHNGAEAIPFTESGERLATVDLTDPDHPRLKAPPPHFEELLARGDDEKGQSSSEGGPGDGENVASPAKADVGVHASKTPDAFSSENTDQHVSTEQLPSAEEVAHVERQTGDPGVTAGREI